MKEYMDKLDELKLRNATASDSEKLEAALAWIEEHKKKSTSHDTILKLLICLSGFCIFPALVLNPSLIIILLDRAPSVIVFGLLAVSCIVYHMFRMVEKAGK